MKAREPRLKVLIDARLWQESGWSDARILNMSSRGLLVHALQVPRRGSYIEITRGTHRIVARVIWADRDRFGVRSQDVIALEAFASGAPVLVPRAAYLNNDRRRRPRDPRSSDSHERSRRWSRRAEFLAVTAAGCAAAFLAFDAVRETLSGPLKLVESQLP